MQVLKLLPLILLTACATAPSSHTCVTQFPYKPEFLSQAADEYDVAGKNIQRMIDDYKIIRAENRVCLKNAQ